jgi:mannose-6-phosphate isomerase-like protein (cupin superfamily)
MTKNLIDKTDKYTFERINIPAFEDMVWQYSKELSTTFLHKGNAYLNLIPSEGKAKSFYIEQGQGFIIAPGTEYNLSNNEDLIAYTVSSKVKPDQEIFEIVDDGIKKTEIPIPEYRIIRNPKKVDKPWGHELWISWFRDFHVMKQIYMNKGNQSSLQFHRDKLETNYLQEGKAHVIDGYKLNPNAPIEEVLESSRGVDFNKFKKEMKPGMHWTSHPGTVHRVIASEDYTAYEVSTPELDDVIRLQDDTQRESGRINSEHLSEKNKK